MRQWAALMGINTEEKQLKTGEPWQPLYVSPKWDILFQMPANALKVWLYHYARENRQRESWPSLKRITKACGMHQDTVVDARRWLRDNGWLVKVREIVREDGEFNIPVFRVERGTIPEKTIRKFSVPPEKSLTTGKKSVLHTENFRCDGTEKYLTEPISVEPVPWEPVPTVVEVGVKRGAPENFRSGQTKAITDPEELKRFLADSPDTQPVALKFMELSGHYLFKKKLHPKDRELMSKAFGKLLGSEPEQHVLNVLAYMAESPQFSRGASTIAKEFPWDWFCARFDQIAACMEADATYKSKLKARIEKEAGEAAKALAKAKQNSDKPLYRQINGEEATKTSTILNF